MTVKARIIKLERSIPTGLEAKLRALTDEEITARIAELCGVTVEEVRVWTPEEYRRLQHEIRAAMPEGSQADAYDAALTALREDTCHWGEEVLPHDPDELEEDQEPYTADAAGLLRFLEGETLPWDVTRRTEIANRPLICAQACGEALDLTELERLGRQVHLDRKLERRLNILNRLRDLRRIADPG